MDYAPIARIALRYVVGAVFMGNEEVGAMLSADPDMVMLASVVIGAAVEAGYALAKRKGWAT